MSPSTRPEPSSPDTSPQQPPEQAAHPDAGPGNNDGWPALPTETEIYILPDGRVVVADLPAELVPLVDELGVAQPCEVVSQPTAGETSTTADA